MFNLEEAVGGWRHQMTASGINVPEVLDELEGHLRDDIEEQLRGGSDPERAFHAAKARMGQAETLRAEFQKAESARRARRRQARWRAAGIAGALFVVGAGLCHFIMAPLLLGAAGRYAAWLNLETNAWRAESYAAFEWRLMLGTGLAFAVPGGLLSLIAAGAVDSRRLASCRSHVIVLNLILAALLTTPEVLTQIMMFVVLQVIYEAMVWTSRAWTRRESKTVKC